MYTTFKILHRCGKFVKVVIIQDVSQIAIYVLQLETTPPPFPRPPRRKEAKGLTNFPTRGGKTRSWVRATHDV